MLKGVRFCIKLKKQVEEFIVFGTIGLDSRLHKFPDELRLNC